MEWNYRVVRRTFNEGGEIKEYYGIHEVYYDDNGKPEACTTEAISVDYYEDIEGIKWALEKIAEALKLPILNYGDF